MYSKNKNTKLTEVGIMRINIEKLIGVAQEHFYDIESYAKKGKEKPYWKRTASETNDMTRLGTRQDASNQEVSDICAILSIDWRKLFTIARLSRKWEQKHNWEKCFPVQEHEKKIIEYLTHDENPRTEREYVHWNINRKAAKAA
jgi:hypothetical protein